MYKDYKIETGLKGKKYYDILESVIGQLSDGIWENSPCMNRYWENQDITRDEEDNIYIISCSRLFRDEMACKKFFANKIKQIVRIEREDGSSELVWKRDNDAATVYISSYGEADYDVLVGDCYYAYDTLLGRNTDKFEYAKG